MSLDGAEQPTSSAPPSSRGAESDWLRDIARADPVDLAAARVGTTLGRFDLHAVLGRGGMGVVFAATDRTLGRAVAIKVLHAHHVDRADRRQRFFREAKAAAAIDHPAVARLLEVGDEAGEVYLVMERVEGRSLRARLREGAVSVGEATRIARGICAALRAAHEAGVIHRDLKPDNVMLGPGGAVKVLDFGLAKLLDPESMPRTTSSDVVTREGQVLGTPGYMSPEQALGHPTDARTDIFAVGVVTFEMLAGRRPFLGATDMETVVTTSRDPAPPLRSLAPGVPRALAAIVHRCLEKDPARRFSSIDAFATAIDRATGPEPSRAALLGGAIAIGLAAFAAFRVVASDGGATAPPPAEPVVSASATPTLAPQVAPEAPPPASAEPRPAPIASATTPEPRAGQSHTAVPRTTRPPRPPETSASAPAAPTSTPALSDPSYTERK